MLYLRDAYLQEFVATVTAADGNAVALDVTAFYPTGGGQPHDTGVLGAARVSAARVSAARVSAVRKVGLDVWHELDGPLPAVGDTVHGAIDWERRYQLMRPHSAMHVLCGVIWQRWGKAVTGGNMQPLSGRMDFAFDPVPEGFATDVESLINAEIIADRPIEVTFLPRGTALEDSDLIRTQANLIPETVTEIRVVDIVGLDKQADGGTYVRSTVEIGALRVAKLENKGKGNKRVRVEILDALD
ncbi:MAG: alanyl-tRNA editing protein [Acidimicrobiia bacterium]